MQKLEELAKRLVSHTTPHSINYAASAEKPSFELVEDTVNVIQRVYSILENCVELYPDSIRFFGKANLSDTQFTKGSPSGLENSSLGGSTGRRFHEEVHAASGMFSEQFMRTEPLGSPSNIFNPPVAERKFLKDKLETYRQEIATNLNVSLRNLQKQKQEDLLSKLNEEMEKNKQSSRKLEKFSLLLSKLRISIRERDFRLETILENFKVIIAPEQIAQESMPALHGISGIFAVIKREVLDDKAGLDITTKDINNELIDIGDMSVADFLKEEFEKQKASIKSTYTAIMEEMKKNLFKITEERDRLRRAGGERESSLKTNFSALERNLKDQTRALESLKIEKAEVEEKCNAIERR